MTAKNGGSADVNDTRSDVKVLGGGFFSNILLVVAGLFVIFSKKQSNCMNVD